MIVTFGLNIIMVLLCTIMIALVKYFRNQEKTDTFILLFSLIVGMTGISLMRCIVLRASDLVNYGQEPMYLLIDSIAILLFCSLFAMNAQEKNKNRKIYSLGILVYLFLFFCYGLKKFADYQNVKSAIYDVLLPRTLCIIGGITIFVSCILLFFKNKSEYIKAYKQDFWKKQIVICNLVFTVLLYPFFETYITNLDEFSFSLSEVVKYVVIIVLSIYILFNLFIFFGEKQYKIIVSGMTILAICSYLQGMFLNSHLFLMDGKELDWSTNLIAINLLLWFALVLIIGFAFTKNKNNIMNIVFGISGIMLAMQLVGGITLFFSAGNSVAAKTTKQDYFSKEGLYTVANENNVIIFVLDTFDIDYWNQIIDEEPDFAEPLEGFISFPDTVSQFSRTYPSIPYMLSEQLYFYEISQAEYNDNAVPSCKIWKELLDNDYQLYFYEESEEYIGSEIRKKAKNYVEEGKELSKNISFEGVLLSMMHLSGYRTMPYLLKANYLYTSEMINGMVVTEISYDKPVFNTLDGIVYQEFDEGLTFTDEKNAFKFIHLNGAHAPYYLDRNCNMVDYKDSNLLEQCRGSMELVYKYLEELKRLDKYEDSMIIITADHGENYVTEELEQNTNPILFIKPMNNDNDKLEISDVYASQNDILPTIASQLGLEYDKEWGLDLLHTNGEDKLRKRYHYYAVVENSLQTKNRTYEIIGSSLDFNNWNATDEYHEFMYY